MLVDNDNLAEVVEHLKNQDRLGFDTETYGLGFNDNMFSMQIAGGDRSFYFNFHKYLESPEAYVLDPKETLNALMPVIQNEETLWFIHNAKFDLHKLANYGVYIAGKTHCTQVTERLIYNQYMRYSLDACLKRRGRAKNDVVVEYMKEHRLYTMRTIEGKKRKQKDMHYDQVPFNLMYQYGLDDAAEVLFLGNKQLEELDPNIHDYYLNECELVKACLDMERIGVKVDKEYIAKAQEYEAGCLEDAIDEASEFAGEEFKNGPKWLRAAFDRGGQEYDLHPKTGNPIFDKAALDKMDSPIAALVKEIRRRDMYLGTYYSSFMHMSDLNSMVRATIRQAGTDTMRFSYADPNLQNVPKEEKFEKGQIQVRKCFNPRSKDHCLVMIDFDQQEFRLMLDYAGEQALIYDINENGEDVHQATATMVGIDRSPAKTLNFGLLYGMGVEKLARALKLSMAEAKSIKNKYFFKLPSVKQLIRDIIHVAETRKTIRTWTGRTMHFPNRDFAYKAPNHLIQGGCADIVRLAMPKLARFLKDFPNSHMIIQVHDEVVFDVHKDDLHIVPNLREIMESIYISRNGMKLTCGVEHSWVSWGKQDSVDGYPRIEIQ